MSVKFKKGTTEVELPDPSPGSKARLVKHQALGLTSSGKRLAYDKGVERYELAVQFESLDDGRRRRAVRLHRRRRQPLRRALPHSKA